jgi:hypothetical protein
MVFTTNDSSKFAGNFNHVCEGNYEIFFDNATRAFGNDSSVDWVRWGVRRNAFRSLNSDHLKEDELHPSISVRNGTRWLAKTGSGQA